MSWPIDANTPVSVTLTAQQWNIVLGALGDAPYRTAAPVVKEIIEQAQRVERPAETEPPTA